MVVETTTLLVVATSVAWTMFVLTLAYCRLDVVARRRSAEYKRIAEQADSDYPKFRYWMLAIFMIIAILTSMGLVIM